MDFSKINLPEPRNTKLQAQNIGVLDYFKFIVACELLKKSQSAVAQTAIYTYLNRNWEEHEKRLEFLAAQRNLSPEELFEQIVRDALKLSNQSEANP